MPDPKPRPISKMRGKGTLPKGGAGNVLKRGVKAIKKQGSSQYKSVKRKLGI